MATESVGARTDAELIDVALEAMTVEEKAAQICITYLPADGRWEPQRGHPRGIVVADREPWQDIRTRIMTYQRTLMASARLPIPALPVARGPLIGATPVVPAMRAAAGWDPQLAQALAELYAMEARAAGVRLLVGPTVAIPARQPSDGGAGTRLGVELMRCSGGDPELAAQLVAATVIGLQGHRDSGRIGSAAVAAMLVQIGGLGQVELHERELRGHTLVPAAAAVRAGALAASPSGGSWAGVPWHSDGWLLREVIRREWGFAGVVISRPDGVRMLATEHSLADGPLTARALAMEAGIDMHDAGAPDQIVELIGAGRLPIALLDEAVAAVLQLKLRVGLFDDPEPVESPTLPVGAGRHRALRDAALAASITLVTDPAGVLPLQLGPHHRIAVLGDPRMAVPGVVPPAVAGVAAALRALPDAPEVLLGVDDGGLGSCTVAVAVVTGEGERVPVPADLPTVVVARTDDVAILPELAAGRAAVLHTWAPAGDEPAIAAVLTGAVEPRGRLPLAVRGHGGGSLPLGHGRGYATIEFEAITLPESITAGAPLPVTVELHNPGERAGREVVQIYLDEAGGSLTRAPRLAGFATVELGPGERGSVVVELPAAALARWDRAMRHVVAPGEREVAVGRSAGEICLRGTTAVTGTVVFM